MYRVIFLRESFASSSRVKSSLTVYENRFISLQRSGRRCQCLEGPGWERRRQDATSSTRQAVEVNEPQNWRYKISICLNSLAVNHTRQPAKTTMRSQLSPDLSVIPAREGGGGKTTGRQDDVATCHTHRWTTPPLGRIVNLLRELYTCGQLRRSIIKLIPQFLQDIFGKVQQYEYTCVWPHDIKLN